MKISTKYNWEETTLKEVIFSVSETFDFSGKNEVHFLNTGDILEGKLLHRNLSLVDSLPGQAKKSFLKNDILYSEIRPANRRYMLVNFDSSNSVASTKLMVLRTKPNVDVNYIYKFLTSRETLAEFQLIAESRSGTFPQITFESISHFPLCLPPFPKQCAIAAVLSSLDDKIELLREQNKSLEATAQAIFKEWFINFNFPGATGKMIDFELGKIPEGWKVGKLGDVTDIRGGTTPSTKNSDFWNGEVNWTSPKDLSNSKEIFLLQTEKKITKEGLQKIGSGLLPKGTLLLSSRAPIGYLAISNIEVAINQGYIAFLSNQYFSNYFMFLWLKINMETVISSANGSTFLEISKSSFRNINCVIPDKNTLKEFNKTIDPLFEKILLNISQTQFLSNLRDTLLSKLIRGELRINK